MIFIDSLIMEARLSLENQHNFEVKSKSSMINDPNILSASKMDIVRVVLSSC